MRKYSGCWIILFIAFFMGGVLCVSGQPNTFYFMKGIPQSKDLNPARPGISSGFYLGLPLFTKLDLSANTNNWSYNDFIHPGTGVQADSLVLDLDKFRGRLGNKNFVQESAALTVLEGGFKKGKNFYAVSLTEKEFTEVFFTKSLINLIEFGNYPYFGTTYFSGKFGVNAQHYRELAFNYSHEVSKKLTVGAAAKILFGIGSVQTNGLYLRATSFDDGSALDVVASGRIKVSAPVDFHYDSKGYVNSINSRSDFSPGDYFKNFGNPGLAVDMGFAYRLNKETELSASVIDLGSIVWKNEVTILEENGHFLYRGIDLNSGSLGTVSLKQEIDALGDSISEAFRPDTASTRFTSLLPVKLYFGIDHQLNDNLSLSGLGRIRILNNSIHTSFTASLNAYLLNGLSLSASYSAMESTFDNLGLGVGLRAGIFQIYAAADNVISPFYPAKARNMNLRVGINLIFDRSSKDKQGGASNRNCHCPY